MKSGGEWSWRRQRGAATAHLACLLSHAVERDEAAVGRLVLERVDIGFLAGIADGRPALEFLGLRELPARGIGIKPDIDRRRRVLVVAVVAVRDLPRIARRQEAGLPVAAADLAHVGDVG